MIAAGATGTASASFAAMPGATNYIASINTLGWCTVTALTRNGTTMTATFLNTSPGAHSPGCQVLILGIKSA